MSPTHQGEGRRTRWLAVLLSILIHAGIVGRGRLELVDTARAGARRRNSSRSRRRWSCSETSAAARAAPRRFPRRHRPPRRRRTARGAQAAGRGDKRAAKDRRAVNRSRRQRRAPRPPSSRRQETRRARGQGGRGEGRSSEEHQRAARERAKRESELRAQLAAEERVNAARGSTEEVAWLALIRDRVTRAWIRPPSARAGVNCEVHGDAGPGRSGDGRADRQLQRRCGRA